MTWRHQTQSQGSRLETSRHWIRREPVLRHVLQGDALKPVFNEKRRKEGRKEGRRKTEGRKEGVSVRVVLSCVCVCLTVTHFFNGRSALTVTTAAYFAAHPFPEGRTASGTERYPSPGFFHQGVPSFALTHGAVPTAPQSTVSGTRVLVA